MKHIVSLFFAPRSLGMAPLRTRGGGYLSKHFSLLFPPSFFSSNWRLRFYALALKRARVSYLVSEYGLLKLGSMAQ